MKIYTNLIAAISFFTILKLPGVKLVRKEDYENATYFWCFVGVITGTITALALWGASYIVPYQVAVIIAYSFRLLLTGALHEDGLADFIDGFGGGSNKKRILEIMKDSHIGSYGVIGLIIYYLLLISIVSSLPLQLSIIAIISSDIWSKYVASNIIYALPYARSEEESKSKIVYHRRGIVLTIPGAIFSILSVYLLMTINNDFLPTLYLVAIISPIIVFIFFTNFLKKRIGGYTGDCCGALFLLSEICFLLTISIINFLW